MADDVAKLGIAVDSAGLKSGTQDLKDFQKEANKTADAADNLNKKWNQGGAKKFADDAKNIKAAVNEQTGAFDAAAAAVQGLASRQIGLVALGGAVVGVTASIGAGAAIMAYQWSTAQASINQSLIGIGRQTGQTVQDINKFSFANASATGLSVGQARDAAVEFNKLGQVSVSQLRGLGDAVYGFSVLTGQDAAKAAKELAGILSGDLTKGAQQLNSVYGTLDGKTIQLVSTLDSQGKKTEAVQVILDKLASQNKESKDSVDILTKSWSGLGNALSYVKNAIPNALSSNSLEDQIAGKQSVLASLPDTSNFSRVKDKLKSEIADLQRSLDSVNAKAAETNLAQLSVAADNVVKSVFPQIDAIKRLKSELDTLNRANGSPQGLSQFNSDAATVISNQIAALEDAQGQASRYNERVAEISKSWGDVGQSTALSLQAANNQLPVFQAVGGAAKMAAQYAADYANYIDRGKTSTEAAALAASNLRAAQAQVSSAAKETLAALRDQYAVASARTPLEAASAQGQVTMNALLRQGVDNETAWSVASQQVANAQAQIYVQMQKAVRASQDQLDLAQAAGTGSEAQVKSAIAYSNAMDAGATSAQAAAISTNTLYSETLKASQAANQLADAELAAARAADDARYVDSGPDYGGFGKFQLKSGITGVSTLTNIGYALQGISKQLSAQYSNGGLGAINSTLAGSGLNSAISSAQMLDTSGRNVYGNILSSKFGVDPSLFATPDAQSVYQNVDALYQLKNAQTNDNSVKKQNLQDELAWLQSQPETLARDQSIVQLYTSIKDLTNATDANTAATLNPLYSQGHGALAIGYYHAATGLDVVAQGNGGTDSIPFHAMVSPNERIRIGSPANNNDSSGMSLTQIINVSGDDTPQRRRNAIQRAQGFVAAAR